VLTVFPTPGTQASFNIVSRSCVDKGRALDVPRYPDWQQSSLPGPFLVALVAVRDRLIRAKVSRNKPSLGCEPVIR
jgi:hypothetical protein